MNAAAANTPDGPMSQWMSTPESTPAPTAAAPITAAAPVGGTPTRAKYTAQDGKSQPS